MKKLWLLLILFIPLRAFALDIETLNSDKILVYDITNNTILYEKNSATETSIASLTKILTTITAIEQIPNLDETVNITKNMLAQSGYNAAIVGLQPGEKVTYRDLLYCIMLPSGADAATVLALNLKENIPDFVKDMNILAKKIGMEHSNFMNVSGLDANNQFSTALDVLTLLKYALNNPTFKTIYSTKEYTLTSGRKIKSTLVKYNDQLNADLSNIVGSKTGLTDNAGMSLTTLVSKNNHEYIIITLGASISNDTPLHLLDHLNIINSLNITESNITITPLKKASSNEVQIDKRIFLIIIGFSGLLLVIPRNKRGK